MNYKNLSDDKSRSKILEKDLIHNSIFLSAGAGSGKTSSLVNRVMALISNDVPVSSIVAITFTREAAKMFYGRMTKELESMISRTSDPEEKVKYQRAFKEIDNAFFGTIDSFCRKLLLEHPAEARISSQLNPLEKPEDKRSIIDQGIETLLKTKSPTQVYENYQELWKWDFYGEEFAQILLYVLEEDIFDLELGEEPRETRTAALIAYLEDVNGVALDLKEEYEERIISGNSFEQSAKLATKSSLKSYEKAIRFINKEHPVNSLFLLENMLAAFNYQDRKGKAEKPDTILERGGQLLENMFFDLIKTEYQELRYYKALNWAKDMRDSLLLLGESQGLISYNRSLKRLVEMLERDKAQGGHLLAYLAKKYSYYLIDELQDTNQLQSQLFDLLAEKQEGALFLVGDEKQAIYRFRGGDVDNFRRLEQSMMMAENEGVLQLTCNFRSSEPLRKWFNSKFQEDNFFACKFPLIEKAEKQSLFESCKDKVIDGVYTFPVIKGKGLKERKIESNEHSQVLAIIKKILGKPVSHYDHKDKSMDLHYLNYDDILLLTYSKKKLKEYMTIFKEEDIPYSVVGSSNLQSSKSLAMMERTIDYLIDPTDSYKEGYCLFNEPFSISEKELYAYKRGELVPIVTVAKNFLENLSAELKNKTPSAMYSYIMDTMKLIHMSSVYDYEDASDTLYYGLELVRQGEQEGSVRSLEDLGEFIKKDLLTGGYEYELSLSGKIKGVRLMNLHKAKGLEGKVVILADPGPSYNSKAEKQYDYENNSIKIFRIGKKGPGGIPLGDLIVTDKFSEEMEDEQAKLMEESMRLRYVAATRAENILIIPSLYKNAGEFSDEPFISKAGEQIEGKWDSLLTPDLKNILDVRMDHLSKNDNKEDKEGEKQRFMKKDVLEITRNFKAPCLVRDESYETINPSKVEMLDLKMVAKQEAFSIGIIGEAPDLVKNLDKLEEWQRSLEKWQNDGSLIGNLVHVLMEALVLRLPELITKEECEVLIKSLIRLQEIPEGDIEFFSEILWNVYNTMMDGGYPQDWADEDVRAPQDLLKELSNAQEIYTELPFSIYESKEDPFMRDLVNVLNLQADKDGYLNGIMDLVYKKEGEYFILDYKTNFFSQDLWQHYEGQIVLYKKVLVKCFGLEEQTKAYLYHIPARDESSLPKRPEE